MTKKAKNIVPGTCSACARYRCGRRKQGVICVYFADLNKAHCGHCGDEIQPGADYSVKDGKVMCVNCMTGRKSESARATDPGTAAPPAQEARPQAQPQPQPQAHAHARSAGPGSALAVSNTSLAVSGGPDGKLSAKDKVAAMKLEPVKRVKA